MLDDLELIWESFVDVIMLAAHKVSGEFKKSSRKKQTPGWDNEVKEEIELKKKV